MSNALVTSAERARFVNHVIALLLGHSLDLFLLVERMCYSHWVNLLESLIDAIMACVRFSIAIGVIWFIIWARIAFAVVCKFKLGAEILEKVSKKGLELFWTVVDFAMPVRRGNQIPEGALHVKSGNHLRDLAAILETDEDLYAGCTVVMDCSQLGSLAETVASIQQAVQVSRTIVWNLQCDVERLDIFKSIVVLAGFGLMRLRSSPCDIILSSSRRGRDPMKALLPKVESVKQADISSTALRRRLSEPCLLTKARRTVIGTDTPDMTLTRRELFKM